MPRNKIILFSLLLLSASLQSQVLTPADAISEALKKNYSIQVEQNTTQIAKNEITRGNAGMLPQVNLNAGGTWSTNDTKQQFLNGTEVDRKGAVTNSANAGLALNWVLFDGMKMFAAYDRLKTQYIQSETNLKIELENTVALVLNNYYSLVKQKQLIKATQNAIKLYEERLSIAETKWKIGSTSKLDYLQAKVDLNEQRSTLLTLQNDYNDSKISMNLLLGRVAETNYEVQDTILLEYDPKYEELKTSAMKQNRQLVLQQQSIRIAELSLKETRSLLYPRLTLNTNYAYSRTESQAGFVLLNQNLGLNGGLTASWSIFNGGNTRRLIKNNELNVMNTKLILESTKLTVEADVLRAYNNFVSSKEILKLEEENYLSAKENAEVALEAFRLGTTSSIELKQAQQSFDDAMVRLVNARYEAKAAETELMRLNGALVK